MADACCHTCSHCAAGGQAVELDGGWCRLRRLPVHPELSRVAWCHHWTARSPSLPVLREEGALGSRVDVQLELHERAFPLAVAADG